MIDDAMGYWLAGLADGESHFGARPTARHGVYRVDLAFQIGLRSDDAPILTAIRDALGVGRIHTTFYAGRKTPLTKWDVARLDDLVDVIVPLFRRYPLRTRKAAEFPIWCEMVELVAVQRAARRSNPIRGEGGRILGMPRTWDVNGSWQRVLALREQLLVARHFQGSMWRFAAVAEVPA